MQLLISWSRAEATDFCAHVLCFNYAPVAAFYLQISGVTLAPQQYNQCNQYDPKAHTGAGKLHTSTVRMLANRGWLMRWKSPIDPMSSGTKMEANS